MDFSRESLDRELPSRLTTIQMNHAAVSPLPARAVSALAEYAAELSTRGPLAYPGWSARTAALREGAARLLGVTEELGGASSIAIVPNTTFGLSLVAQGLDWRPGDVVVTTDSEFPANLTPWLDLARLGVEVRRIPTRDGAFTAEEVFAACNARTRLVGRSVGESRLDPAPQVQSVDINLSVAIVLPDDPVAIDVGSILAETVVRQPPLLAGLEVAEVDFAKANIAEILPDHAAGPDGRIELVRSRRVHGEPLRRLQIGRLELPGCGWIGVALGLPDDPRPVDHRIDFVAGRRIGQRHDGSRDGEIHEEDIPVAILAASLPDRVASVGA